MSTAVSRTRQEELPDDLAADLPAGPPPTESPAQSLLAGDYIQTVCLVLLAVVASGWALAVLRPIITPLLVALFFYFLLLPVSEALNRWRVPRAVSGILFFVLVLAVLLGLGMLFYSSIAAVKEQLPEYQKGVVDRTNALLLATGFRTPDDGQELRHATFAKFMEQAWNDNVGSVFGGLLGFVEITLMVVFYLFFLFIEAKTLPSRIRDAFHPRTADDTERLSDDINDRIKEYLLYKTYINVGLAVVHGAICYFAGLHFWPLWALSMFLLNYVTYIGSVVALIPPVLLAFIQFENPWVGVGLAAALTLNRIFWIDYVEILSLGSVLNLSPLVLLLSITFFGMIWGPVGLVLAVPLVTTLKIILSDFERTRHIAVLMSEE